MTQVQDAITMTLVDAARALKVPYPAAYRLLLTQALVGERRGGRWYVSADSVLRLSREGAQSEPVPA